MEAHLFRVFRRLQHTHQHTVSDPWAGRLDMFYLFYLCGCFLLHSHFHSITSHSSPLLPPFPSESGLVIFLFDLCIYPPLIPLLLWHPSAGALKECTPPKTQPDPPLYFPPLLPSFFTHPHPLPRPCSVHVQPPHQKWFVRSTSILPHPDFTPSCNS